MAGTDTLKTDPSKLLELAKDTPEVDIIIRNMR